ncbi:hypothetical protein BH10PSE16_BH10PSE16_30670 [soil metagenome]
MNTQTCNALMNQQVPQLTLRQRELLKKRPDELDEQQKGWPSLSRPARLSRAAAHTAKAPSFSGMATSVGYSATAAGHATALNSDIANTDGSASALSI